MNPRTIACVGIDPGASSGLAAVAVGTGRPRLLGVGFAYGVQHMWWNRAVSAVGRLQLQAREECGDGIIPPVFVENPPPTFQEGSLGSKVKRGHASWMGLGKWRGMCLSAALHHDLRPTDIDHGAWVDVVRASLGRIATGKTDADAGLRIREACSLIEGARAFFQREDAGGLLLGGRPVHKDALSASSSRLVDVAEAMLISAAGGYLALQHGGKIPAEALRSKQQNARNQRNRQSRQASRRRTR